MRRSAAAREVGEQPPRFGRVESLGNPPYSRLRPKLHL